MREMTASEVDGTGGNSSEVFRYFILHAVYHGIAQAAEENV